MSTHAFAPIEGFTAAGFDGVRDAFEQNFADELELGAGFAAWLGDELIVDLRGGWADRARTRPWTSRTLVPVYSTTKPIAALMAAQLVGRGLVDYDRPLADYWPEFAQNGKAAVTVAQALSHQAGLSGFAEPIDPELWLDPRGLAEALAALAPLWPLGEGSGYHPITFGFLVGELFRRVDGRTLGMALREDVTTPLEIDFWIGTPESEHARCAEILKPREATRFGAHSEALEAAFRKPWSAPARGGADWRKAEIPSANGHGTAASTARLYSAFALKGRIGELRLFPTDVWEQLTRRRVIGPDRVLPDVMEFAAGVMRNNNRVFGPNPATLAHSGWGGSAALGDPDLGLSAAYVMNRQGPDLLRDARRARLIEALYAAL